jgi:bifunctional non-homologous end joining protein LigD
VAFQLIKTQPIGSAGSSFLCSLGLRKNRPDVLYCRNLRACVHTNAALGQRFCSQDGYSDFNALHSGKHNDEVQLCAFDVHAMDGHCADCRYRLRKANLARPLARRPDGIFPSDFEQGEIGAALFVAACRMGLEGLVSKHRDRPYRNGRSKYWIKVKNSKASSDAAGDGRARLERFRDSQLV